MFVLVFLVQVQMKEDAISELTADAETLHQQHKEFLAKVHILISMCLFLKFISRKGQYISMFQKANHH